MVFYWNKYAIRVKDQGIEPRLQGRLISGSTLQDPCNTLFFVDMSGKREYERAMALPLPKLRGASLFQSIVHCPRYRGISHVQLECVTTLEPVLSTLSSQGVRKASLHRIGGFRCRKSQWSYPRGEE
jgi:hypothetical protein